MSFQIFLGSATLNSAEGQSFDVDADSAIINPNYDDVTLNYNAALIQLPEPVQFSGEDLQVVETSTKTID